MLPVRLRRVFLAQHRVDFRMGADGLLGEAYRLGADPYSGDCIVFVKRDQRQLRALVGDAIGVYVVMRRFEGARVRLIEAFTERPTGAAISTGELSLLLEGARFTVHKRAGAWRPTTAPCTFVDTERKL
jgi:IS66 Orf2 like protein